MQTIHAIRSIKSSGNLFLGVIVCIFLGNIGDAQTIASGRVTVVDGDTLEMHGQRIRLHGIDAPESKQSCIDKKGIAYRCGQIAARQMASYVIGNSVTCHVTDQDGYGRLVAKCYVRGQDINERLVSEGWALAYQQYSTDYVDSEALAKSRRIGVWKGMLVEPWRWRRGARLEPITKGNKNGCEIKGNISDRGKIYHNLKSPWYSQTKIDIQKGERWFCSEAEAEAAGWRSVQ